MCIPSHTTTGMYHTIMFFFLLTCSVQFPYLVVPSCGTPVAHSQKAQAGLGLDIMDQLIELRNTSNKNQELEQEIRSLEGVK